MQFLDDFVLYFGGSDLPVRASAFMESPTVLYVWSHNHVVPTGKLKSFKYYTSKLKRYNILKGEKVSASYFLLISLTQEPFAQKSSTMVLELVFNNLTFFQNV